MSRDQEMVPVKKSRIFTDRPKENVQRIRGQIRVRSRKESELEAGN
jgi:hypothetical protein